MLFTVQQVAARCQVDQEQVLSWIHSGELTAINMAKKAGGRPLWRIRPDKLDEFEQQRTAGAAPEPKQRRRSGRLVIPRIVRASVG